MRRITMRDLRKDIDYEQQVNNRLRVQLRQRDDELAATKQELTTTSEKNRKLEQDLETCRKLLSQKDQKLSETIDMIVDLRCAVRAVVNSLKIA